MNKYFKFNTKFRNETYDFVVKHRQYLNMTGSDVQKIVSKKFGATIPEAEISYNKVAIDEQDYEDSELDKYNPQVNVREV